MFAKFDEIPSLPVPDIKENPKCCVVKELQRAITLTELVLSPYFSIINVTLRISMCLPNFMKFHHCLYKILENKNVVDRWADEQTD